MFSNLKNRGALLAAPLVLGAGSTMAAVPEDVSTALAGAKTDAVAVAALVIVIIVAVYAFKAMRKAIG